MSGHELQGTLSFVIPAYNEAAGIARCVSSIARYAPPALLREIIVVDNGSKDDTAALARAAGATVVASGASTIGGVRNDGVAASSGSILVFLDADCALTPEWTAECGAVLSELSTVPLSCAGSQVHPPAGESVFLWKYWFMPFVMQASASHVGSAHMICRRDDFLRLGGFDDTLETGEDFEFCARVHGAGGHLLNRPELKVEHYGFPRSWRQFMKRERWHGRGDVASLEALLGSKVAVASILFVALTVGGMTALLLGFGRAAVLALAGAGLLLVAASTVKFRHAGPRIQLVSLGILPAYFLARTLSLLDAPWRRTEGRPSVRSQRTADHS